MPAPVTTSVMDATAQLHGTAGSALTVQSAKTVSENIQVTLPSTLALLTTNMAMVASDQQHPMMTIQLISYHTFDTKLTSDVVYVSQSAVVPTVSSTPLNVDQLVLHVR